VKFDGFIQALRSGEIYDDLEWDIYEDDGTLSKIRRPYVIVDGGYHNWTVTITASSIISNHYFRNWQKRMESVRKDIECVFGRLKGRFRVLKCPVNFQKKNEIDNMVITCVTLYNILHLWDGLGDWESKLGVDCSGRDGDFMDDEETMGTLYADPSSNNQPIGFDTSRQGMHHFPPGSLIDNIETSDHEEIYFEELPRQRRRLPNVHELVDVHTQQELGYMELRSKLINHYKIAVQNREVTWLRSQGTTPDEFRI
jgi:hypothetical protein